MAPGRPPGLVAAAGQELVIYDGADLLREVQRISLPAACKSLVSNGDMVGAEVRMLTIPPGSLVNWGKYVARLCETGLTYKAVMTEPSVEPYKGAYKLAFHSVGRLPDEAYLALKARRESAVAASMQPCLSLEEGEAAREAAPAQQEHEAPLPVRSLFSGMGIEATFGGARIPASTRFP